MDRSHILDVVRGGGKTKDGKVLYTDATPAGEKVSNIINHLVRSQAPFSLQQLIRLGFAATGEPSRTDWTLPGNRTRI